ncbi:MAG: GNAT family N-acetyltransferase [Clostridiales bacterium]|nr:GNAT family N-acetyltransferase [Clostridiales bacterium]
MDIRVLQGDDIKKAAALWKYCFGDTDEFTDWYFSCHEDRHVLGMMEGDELMAQIVCTHQDVGVRGVDRGAAILSGVATAPSCRGRGFMSELMTHGLSYVRQRGESLAALYPYEYRFYEQYGFAKCGEVAKVNAPIGRLTAAKLMGEVVMLKGGGEDKAKLVRAYEASYGGYSGRVRREESDFARLLEELAQDGGYGAVYRRDGEEKGYILYVMRGEVMDIREIGAADHIARQDMYGFICSHSSTMQTAEFLCPLDDPLWRLISDPRGLVSAEPYAMLRMVEMEITMQGLPAGDGLVTMKVMDPYAPWNEGVWQFFGSDGKLDVEKIPDPGFGELSVISIGDLTQWAFGYAGGRDLQRQGALLTDICAEIMDDILPKRPVFLYEKY